MFVQGSHTFAVFYAHALREKRGIPVLYAITWFAQTAAYACIIWPCYARSHTIFRPDEAMNLALLHKNIWTSFFFCLVCHLLEKVNLNNSWGNWEHLGRNFYMGMQNGSNLDVLLGRLLIHTFELGTLRLFHVLQEDHTFAIFSAHALRSKRGIPVLHTHICTWRPLPDLLKTAL